jgi:hypothetical protein
MSRFISALALVSACCLAAGCGDDPVATTPSDPPVEVTETFTGTLDLHGASMHTFFTDKGPAQAIATLDSLSPDSTAVVSFMFGTWNGQYCQVILVKDDATTSANLIGTASAVGSFCVRVSDIGRLTQPTNYAIKVTHF